MRRQEILKIMELIKNKICIHTYTYINKEERLLTVLEVIHQRKLITSEEFIKWLQGFVNVSVEENIMQAIEDILSLSICA